MKSDVGHLKAVNLVIFLNDMFQGLFPMKDDHCPIVLSRNRNPVLQFYSITNPALRIVMRYLDTTGRYKKVPVQNASHAFLQSQIVVLGRLQKRSDSGYCVSLLAYPDGESSSPIPHKIR